MSSDLGPLDPDARRGPGGTPGGVGTFAGGLAMTVAGGYLILQQVQVTSGYWHWWGTNTFGLTLLPLVVGIGLLFDGRSVVGWTLAGLGAVIVFTGILTNLEVYFRQTSLFNLIAMLVLFAGGLGLVARSLRPAATGADARRDADREDAARR